MKTQKAFHQKDIYNVFDTEEYQQDISVFTVGSIVAKHSQNTFAIDSSMMENVIDEDDLFIFGENKYQLIDNPIEFFVNSINQDDVFDGDSISFDIDNFILYIPVNRRNASIDYGRDKLAEYGIPYNVTEVVKDIQHKNFNNIKIKLDKDTDERSLFSNIVTAQQAFLLNSMA
jgi:hypothetical protein